MSSLFQWAEHSWLGTYVNNSLWAFAAFEAVHLLALAVIGGAVLIVDLRTLGWVFPRQRVAEIAAEARPWLIGSVTAMFRSGYCPTGMRVTVFMAAMSMTETSLSPELAT